MITEEDLMPLVQMFNWPPGKVGTNVQTIYWKMLVKKAEVLSEEIDEGCVQVVLCTHEDNGSKQSQKLLLTPRDL